MRSRFCAAHQPPPHVARYAAFYATKAWRDVRRRYIGTHPKCEWPGCEDPASQIDHVVPIGCGGSRFSSANLQSLCDAHHAIKTYHLDKLIRPGMTPDAVRSMIAASKWARSDHQP